MRLYSSPLIFLKYCPKSSVGSGRIHLKNIWNILGKREIRILQFFCSVPAEIHQFDDLILSNKYCFLLNFYNLQITFWFTTDITTFFVENYRVVNFIVCLYETNAKNRRSLSMTSKRMKGVVILVSSCRNPCISILLNYFFTLA